MPGGGLVQEVDGKQAGRLAVNGGLVPTEATNGGIACGGSAEPIGEGVTGHLPLEWVAPHAVGARERLFPLEALVHTKRFTTNMYETVSLNRRHPNEGDVSE